MNIGAAAKLSGLSAKQLRTYEHNGLLRPALRADNGYRRYSQEDLPALRFIKSAREMGFSLEEVGQLLALQQDPSRASAHVKVLAKQHLQAMNQRIQELTSLRDNLAQLIQQCPGDQSPHCSILQALAQP